MHHRLHCIIELSNELHFLMSGFPMNSPLPPLVILVQPKSPPEVACLWLVDSYQQFHQTGFISSVPFLSSCLTAAIERADAKAGRRTQSARPCNQSAGRLKRTASGMRSIDSSSE